MTEGEFSTMKNNQFARLAVDHPTMVAELKRIRFFDEKVACAQTPTECYRLLLRKAFVNVRGVHEFDVKLRNYLATPARDLQDYLAAGGPITPEVFYLVALQLGGFLPDVDFSIADPLAAMKQIQLPMIAADGPWDKDRLLDAWYVWLTTHTKNGQTYLDQLASQGYFVPLFALPIAEKPLFFNGKAQAVFDTAKLIREVVYVESSVDSDEDGRRDLLKVEIVRPEDTERGLRVPTLFTASPYNQGINDEAGKKATHNVDVPLTEKRQNDLRYEDIAYHAPTVAPPAPRPVRGESKYATETFDREQSYTLNDYFLARGFAAVYAAGIGTLDSDGIQTCGDPQQTAATVAVIEWLTGRRRAFTNRTDHIAIAAWWSSGKVAMTGRSYLGTLANAAAVTGVPGLKTIIAEAAISSWYDYYRDGGLIIAPGGFPGEDADVLAIETMSRMKAAADYRLRIGDFFKQKMRQMAGEMARGSGDYNTFWDARNYRKWVKRVQCDVLIVHGLNDWNVKPRNAERLWQALRAVPVTKKLILHQGRHIYINAFRSFDYTDIVNLWLSHELYGLENGAKTALPGVIVQDNVTPETWTACNDWAAPALPRMTYYPAPGKLLLAAGSGRQSFKDDLPQAVFARYAAHVDQWERDLKSEEATELSGNRLLLRSAPLEAERIVDGVATVRVRVASSRSYGMLSFQLVDYGRARRFNTDPTPLGRLPLGHRWREDRLREFTLAKSETPFKMISKGHINLQNREHPWKTDALRPGEFYDVTIELQPTFHRLVRGHRLGLVVYATDFGMTVRGNQDLRYTLDFGGCRLDVPLRMPGK
jgi:X-Pro dipeptidyl-peptidase